MDPEVVEITPPIYQKQVSNYSSFSVQSFDFYSNFHMGFQFKVMIIILKFIAFAKILLLFLFGKLGIGIHV
jgi:hypothetical protein